MKRLFLPLAAGLLLAASCSTNTNDSRYSNTYFDYNLIIDNDNPDAAAQASYSGYDVTLYYTSGAVEVKGNDLIVNNQKYSFETDTMACGSYYFKALIDGVETSIGQTTFSKKGLVGTGAQVTNLKGAMIGMFAPATSDSLSSSFNIRLVERLDLNYTLANRYEVQTFWPSSLYLGQTYAYSTDGGSLSTRNTRYMVNVNFAQNKANVFIYNPELSSADNNLPKVIRIGDVPVRFNHDSYYLEADAPKTTVLGKRNNVPALVDSVGFQVENFSLRLISQDLTEAEISYKLQGKSVTFVGNCVPKPAY